MTALTAAMAASLAGAPNAGAAPFAGAASPIPAVSAVAPSTGSDEGGTALTVTGQGFADGDNVTVGGVPATDVVVVSPTTLTAVTPVGTEARDVEVSSAAGASPTSAADTFTYVADSRFEPLTPVRVLDTRSSLGGHQGAVGAKQSVTVDLSGSVPATATAVVFNLTAVSPTASTFLTAYPAGGSVPATSSIDVVKGQTAANSVTVELGAGRKVSVYNLAGSTHVLMDLAGYEIAEPLVVVPRPLQATVGRSSSITYEAVGYPSDELAWSTTSGTPSGLEDPSGSGGLSGTPLVAGSYTEAVTVSDPNGRSASGSLSLTIAPRTPLNAVALSAGGSNTCAIVAGGSVDCWGEYAASAGTGALAPTPVSGLGSATAVATDGGSSCAIVGGAAYCWGASQYGEGDYPQPTKIVADAVQVSVASDTTCATASTGSVTCWGYGVMSSSNQHGLPQQIAGISGAVQTVVGGDFACSLLGDGTVLCWGANDEGQLGQGDSAEHGGPVAVHGLSTVTSLSGGGESACALLASGAVDCWGSGAHGELGNGGTTNETSPSPVQGLSDATRLDEGDHDASACAVRAAGSVVCWGANADGQLGNGSTADAPIPVAVTGLDNATSVTVGEQHACATRSDGTAVCWGDDRAGELDGGLGPNSDGPLSVVAANDATSVVASWNSSCGLLSGSVECWGSLFGEPGEPSPSPSPIAGTAGAVSLALGGSAELGSGAGCAVLSNKSVACWGDAPGSTTNSGSTAAPVSGLSGVARLAMNASTACAVTTTGAVECWGDNTYGQLGNGTTTSSATPEVVQGLPDATTIAVGTTAVCITGADGSVWCWGQGHLGTTTDLTMAKTPQQVPNLASATEVAVGDDDICVVLSSAVDCWGAEGSGQLGRLNSATSIDLPAPVSDLTNATEVSLGVDFACSLGSDGSVTCWGGDTDGQLGSGGEQFSIERPQVVGGLTSVTGLALGLRHACAVDSGAVQCWGTDAYGELGLGAYPIALTPQVVLA